ncbi:YidH family protein [Pedobacter sp.]|uniref:YidH family protein n=1 Tax=Pedobacter sp. TaxID=1411316 RepID=UPI003C31ADBE
MISDKENNTSSYKANDHLANERTYLAWIRTGIGIMAFGFVVVKFSLFVKQIGVVLQTKPASASHGYSNVIGIILVALGMLAILFAFLQYRRTEKQLKTGSYVPTTLLTTLLTGVLFLISILLIAYLLQSV